MENPPGRHGVEGGRTRAVWVREGKALLSKAGIQFENSSQQPNLVEVWRHKLKEETKVAASQEWETDTHFGALPHFLHVITPVNCMPLFLALKAFPEKGPHPRWCLPSPSSSIQASHGALGTFCSHKGFPASRQTELISLVSAAG